MSKNKPKKSVICFCQFPKEVQDRISADFIMQMTNGYHDAVEQMKVAYPDTWEEEASTWLSSLIIAAQIQLYDLAIEGIPDIHKQQLSLGTVSAIAQAIHHACETACIEAPPPPATHEHPRRIQ